VYRDWAYWREQATNIANDIGVKFEKGKLTYNKGQFFARLEFPASIRNAENYWEARKNYLLDKVGFEISTESGSYSYDQEQAKNYLIGSIASDLSKHNKLNRKQNVSELYEYYKNNSGSIDISFPGEIGRDRLDYFKVLQGDINEENWQNKNLYSGEVKNNISNFKTFKELYYALKQSAKDSWLKNNDELTREVRKKSYDSKEVVKNFVFDEETIPEIAIFEKQLEGAGTQPNESVNNIELIRKIDSGKLSNAGYTKVGYRANKFLKSKIWVGREREIMFPNEERHESYFAIVELDEILASHNEKTFGNTEEYPTDETGRNINDRNYASDKNAQAKVISVAQKLNPNIIISTSATSSGTPIITIDGIVVSGNNRTMSMKIAASSYPDIFEQYKTTLANELNFGGYGIGADTLKGFSKPILVRFDASFPGYITSELNKYNKSRGKSEKGIDIAIRLARQLKDNSACQNSLIQLVSEQEIVSEIYKDRDAIVRLRKILLDCNIITENEISAMFSGNTLSDNGKILYETLLLSLVLEPNAIEISQNDGVKSATRSIVNAIIPLVKNKQLGAGSLIENINMALLIQNDMVSRGYNELEKYVGQGKLFENDYLATDEKSVVLNWFMNQGVNLLKTTLIKYNNSMESNTGESIFGDNLTPEEIFAETFEKQTDSRILGLFKTAPAPAPEKELSLPSEKENLETRISTLEKAKKYQSEDDQRNIDELINNLKKALKYL
jgi:hypothetical protein